MPTPFRLLLIVLFATLTQLLGCASSSKAPVTLDPIALPIINSFRDIGALVPSTANLKKMESDERIFPGELLAISGAHIADCQIEVDGIPTEIEKVLAKEILVRVPLGLNPLKKHTLTITNDFGSASLEFFSQHYIIASDTDDNRLHFMRTHAEEKGHIEMDTAYKMELDHKRVMLTLLSPSGGFLYSFGTEEKQSSKQSVSGNLFQVSLKLIHLAAQGEPKELKELSLKLHSQPVAVTMADENHLLLIGSRDVAILDVSDELTPKLVHRFDLTPALEEPHYIDAIALNGGRHLVALESLSNQLVVYDLADIRQPELINRVAIYPGLELPVTVDLEADPNSPNQFWVLAGSNLRSLASNLLTETQKLLTEKEKELGKVPEQLVQFTLENQQLQAKDTIPLPENFVPFFARFGSNEQLYVTGVNGNFIDFETMEFDLSLFKKLMGGLFNTVQFGRVLQITPATQEVTNHAQGLGLYYHLDYLEEFGPIFSLYKMGGTIWAPYVKVKWGVGVKSRGTFGIRDGHYKVIFPPYSVGHISVQH